MKLTCPVCGAEPVSAIDIDNSSRRRLECYGTIDGVFHQVVIAANRKPRRIAAWLAAFGKARLEKESEGK